MAAFRITVAAPLLLAVAAVSGCAHHRKRRSFSVAELLAVALHRKSKLLQAQAQQQQALMGLENEKQLLWDHTNGLESELSTANERIKNLMAERDALNEQYAKAMQGEGTLVAGAPGAVPLAGDKFEFDPTTGLNKFRSDVLFDWAAISSAPKRNRSWRTLLRL